LHRGSFIQTLGDGRSRFDESSTQVAHGVKAAHELPMVVK